MTRTATRVLAGVGALGLALFLPVSTASAQSGDAVITNTETVNATLSPSGEVDVVRFYDQISVQGSGEVSYSNPVSTAGLRNLDTFGSFTVEDGSIVESTTVDGLFRQRSLSDFDKDLPVTVAVVYTLDGEEISPSDLVGKSGKVEVEYTITNATCEEQEVTVDGATGPEKVKEEVCDPLAGSLSFTLPSQYADITSDNGFVTAGDGRGGTLMTLSITMISGLTGSEVVAGYSAQVQNAVVPPASMSIIPVVVDANPSASAQKEALAGGAETGKTLAAGAGEIDANVLRLADGAGTLVSGLLLLRDGSAQLSNGLVNTAAPGAQQLASGLNNTAVPGSQQLAAGTAQVASGIAGLNNGLSLLYAGVDALPVTIQQQLAASPQYNALLGGLTAIIQGLRAPGTTDCEVGLAGGDPDNCGAMDAVQLVSQLLGGAAAENGPIAGFVSDATDAYTGISCPPSSLLPVPVPLPPVIPPTVLTASPPQGLGISATAPCVLISNVVYGLGLPKDASPAQPAGGLQAQTEAASDALVKVYEGVDAEIIPGLETIQASIPVLINTVVAGIEQQLLTAIGAPTPGCNPSSSLRCASAALATGSATVAAGAGALSSGLVTAGDGASQLADGLQSAADGSVTIAGGLDSAAQSAPALPEGATRLSKEGTSQIVAAGQETALSFGTRVAVLEASAERTADGALPYGAPEGALKAAAYKYDLNGASGAGSENAAQLVAGLAIAGGAAAGAGVLARRRSASA